jgi:hypothetical protein
LCVKSKVNEQKAIYQNLGLSNERV